jgi:hypothetical protein
MREILHIFKKDIRRHWPEILVTLAFLGLYLKETLKEPDHAAYASLFFFFSRLSAESVAPLMVLFWVFLTVRIVQGEPLVGDRQWWITKPYEWWKLLAAKEAFLLVFVAFPLFVVQLFLLHHAGFPILPNILRVLYMQLALGVFLSLPSVALASLTRNLWQAVLAVVLALVVVSVVASLLNSIPSHSMSSKVQEIAGDAAAPLVPGSIIGAVGWQFARRRTWASRGLLVSGPALVALLSAVTPYAKLVEKKYPLAEVSAVPAHFTPVIPNVPPKKRSNSFYEPRDVFLRIPLLVSGILIGHAVQVDGVRVSMESAGFPRWDSGWESRGEQLWTESQQTDVSYQMKRWEFEARKTKPVRLHLELALTEYQETEPRDLILQEGKFSDPQLGFCHLDDRNPSWITCIRPFQALGLMASFDPSKASCETPEDDQYVPDDRVSHTRFSPHYNEDSSSTLLNPVVEYPIVFGTRFSWLPTDNGAKRKVKRVYLCPGAKLQLAKPKEIGHVRVRFDLEGVRLESLTLRPEFDWNQ